MPKDLDMLEAWALGKEMNCSADKCTGRGKKT